MLKAWIDNFLKPGNLAGGFAYYQAAHAGRVAIMREQAPVLPPIGVPTCMRWAEHDPLRERGQDRVFQSDQMASSGGRGWGKLVFLEPFPKLSVRDKPLRRDETLDTLLYLDGEIIALDEEGAYWVKFEVRRIPETPEKPHGLDYSLTLHGPGSGDDDDSRLVGFDNAHQVRGKRRDPSAWDHKHRFKSVRPYDYSDAAALLADFWAAVESVLDERGINR